MAVGQELQLDMFGEAGAPGEAIAVPPVMTAQGWKMAETLAFTGALRRGALVEALGILNRAKIGTAQKVLVETGFAVGSSDSRATMMAPAQRDIIEAAQRRVTGHELKALREAEKNVEHDREDEHGSALQPENVLARNGVEDRDAGIDRGVDREPLGARLAGTSAWSVGQQGISAGADRTGGAGENGVGGSSESAASGTTGNPGDVRIAGRPADALGDGQRNNELNAGTPARDHVLTDEDRIGLGGLGEKFRDNLAAIDVLKTLAAEKRNATPDERRSLARYVGWGGLKNVFDANNTQWKRQHDALKARLSDDEWAAARRSTLDAFYTPPVAVKTIYAAAARLGFTRGHIIDPSVGVGNFFGLMPPEMRQGSTLHGCELDILTSQIVAALYPSAKIAKATGFQDYAVPAGYFDMVTGNPPFGSQPIVDEANSVYSGWSIHNYFFAKSIEMLRPGGIMPMVVSHSFLDKLDPHVRQWISRRAELVSGVRLPNTAFKENANTEVVTDILIFKRLDETQALGRESVPDWLNTSDVEVLNTKTGEMAVVSINDYFVKNPGQVLGTTAVESGLYRANEYTVLPSGDLEVQLAAWVETLPEGVYVPLERSAAEMESAVAEIEVPEGVKEGSFFVDQGAVRQRLSDAFGKQRSAPWEAPNQRALERMRGMIEIRDVLREQMRLERSRNGDEAAIERHREKLGGVYDAFVREFGFLNDPVNRRLFMDDTESALIQALEFDYEKAVTASKAAEYGIDVRPARATRADILSRRVLFPPIEIASAASAKDALVHSLNIHGRVDVAYMERLYGKGEAEILLELGDVLYRDPVHGLVTADEYLSGDVKTKLAEAQGAAKTEPAYARNVAALEAVIPKDKLPSEIFASIGGTWIPKDIYAAFAKEISGAEVSYGYVKATAQWLAVNTGGAVYAKNNSDFGTERMGALDILHHTMNSKGVEVKKRVMMDGREQYVTDEDATEGARAKADAIRAHWDSWLWADGARADRLTALYNERFNRTVERAFDGTHLTFPGMNPAITLLNHQKNGVWRGVQDRTMLADKVVGSGKTYEMATIAMEMRRLGIAKKPMFAVPNHLTLQWRSDFARLYPGANILAATPQDFEKDNREKLFSKIVTGNWDAVIVGHSSLKKLGVPKDAEVKIIKEQFDEISDAIEDMKRERGDRAIVRDMERIKATLKAKLDTMVAKGGKKDNVVDFADLGVDAIFVDEMHEFKNLFFSTQMSRVAGLGNPAGSGKAFDLFVKIRWLKETFGEDAPLVTGTGTPVSNSLAEMYTMQRYMQYETLQAQGLHHFDAWAKQYGDVQTVYEVAPSGTGYRLSQRFAKFKNLPSLMGSYRSFADVVTLDDLKAQETALGKVFPVPKIKGGRPLNVVARRSELQERFFGVPEIVKDEAGNPVFEIDLSKPVSIAQNKEGKWVLAVGDAYSKTFDKEEDAVYALAAGATTPRMTIDPESIVGQFENLRELTRSTKGKINALSLTGLANKAGLDYRIIDPAAQDFAGSKINLAIDNMMASYEKWTADKGVQLVFCDLSVPLSAKAKMASKEKRVYVRDEKGDLVHKMGTLHTIKGYEGLPYYLVAEGKGKGKTFAMYDPVTGHYMKGGFDSKQDAHAFAKDFVTKEGGQERWLDQREASRCIDADEVDDYKNTHALNDDGDAADLEISAQDIEGATGVAGFSVYDDIKAKLIARGVPAHEIEFIHDHDTPQAKAALFKRVNDGDVRYLLGSTPKMGAGTNVQQRLVALHHIDAPWRPSDLEQREGRIIRRGNLLYARDPDNFEVEVNRYATEQTYDTRRWQLLEHKAAGVDQLRNYKGENEIDDVASEAANSADMKAAASGNPLILKETQLATEIKKLAALERSHRDSEFMVRHRVQNLQSYATLFGPKFVADMKAMQEKCATATMLGSFEGRPLEDKEAVHKALGRIAVAMNEMGAKKSLVYRGVQFEFEKVWETRVAYRTPDGEATLMDQVSPTGAVTRMENWIAGMGEQIAAVEARIAHSASEAEKLAETIGKPFARAGELTTLIADHGKVQRALMKANSSAAVKPDERNVFDLAVARQKAMLREKGFEGAMKMVEVCEMEDVGTAAPRAAVVEAPAVEVQRRVAGGRC